MTSGLITSGAWMATADISPLDPDTLDWLDSAIWVLDPDTHLVLWQNACAQSISGEPDFSDLSLGQHHDSLIDGAPVTDRVTVTQPNGVDELTVKLRRVDRIDGTWLCLLEATESPASHPDYMDESLPDRALLALDAIDQTTGMITLLRPDGQILFQNTAADEAFGPLPKTGEEPLFYQLRFFDAEDWFDFKASIQEKSRIEVQRRVLTKDGAVWHVLYARQIKNPLDGSDTILIQEADISQRKAAEDALTASENRYRTLVNSSEMGIWQLDTDFCAVHLNSYLMTRFDAYQIEQVQSEGILAVLDSTGAALLTDRLIQLALTPDMDNPPLEVTLTLAAGKEVRYLLNTSAILDAADKVCGFLGTLIDLSYKQAAAEAADKRQKLMDDILDVLPIAITMKDGDGQYVMVNHEAALSMGQSAEALVGQTDFDVYDAEMARLEKQEDLAVHVRRTTQLDEKQLHTPDGSRTHYTGKTLVEGVDGEDYILSFGMDITATKQLQDEVEREQAFSELALDANPNPNIIFEAEGSVAYANPATAELLGIDLDELVQTGPIEALTPFMARLSTVIEEGAHVDMPVTFITPQAEKRMLLVRKTPIIRAGGEPLAFCVAIDVTEREQAIAAMAEARDAAERANQTKSEFVAAMSHEIRTPMNGILGMSRQLIETPMTSDQTYMTRTIRDSAEALLLVINDILDFSKIEAGHMTLDTVDYDLSTTVDGVVDLLLPRVREKGLSLTSTIAADVPLYLRGDPGRMRQILVNLIGNAVKFTETGSVKVHVQKANTDQHLRVEVTDTGIGIPQDHMPHLFDRFTQVDQTNRRQFGGSGLGLAIVKQLIEMMGGTVGVNSTENVGSTFWFEWPAVEGEIPPDAIPDAEKRILYMDTTMELADILDRQLSHWGMDLTIAHSEGQAIDLLTYAEKSEAPFDAVLVDENIMRTGTVFPVLMQNSRPAGAQQFILIHTAKTGDADAEFLQALFDDVLPKPMRQQDLKRILSDPEPVETAAESYKILLAEDNEVNQDLTRRLLAAKGHSLTIVANGKAAVDAVQSEPFDMILMDVQMPVMDGVEATHQIQSLAHGFGKIPILAMTANALPSLTDEFREAGMVDIVTKPVEPDQLYAKVSDWGAKGRAISAEIPQSAYVKAAPQSETAPQPSASPQSEETHSDASDLDEPIDGLETTGGIMGVNAAETPEPPKPASAPASSKPKTGKSKPRKKIKLEAVITRPSAKTADLQKAIKDLVKALGDTSDIETDPRPLMPPDNPKSLIEHAVVDLCSAVNDPKTFDRGTFADRVKGRAPKPAQGDAPSPPDEADDFGVFTEDEPVITDPLFDDLSAFGIGWSPLINRQAIDDLVEILGPDECQELLGVFVGSSDRLHEALMKAVADNDLAALTAHSHSYKSAAGNIGLRALFELARHIESASSGGEPDRAFALVDLIQGLQDVTLDAFRSAYPELADKAAD